MFVDKDGKKKTVTHVYINYTKVIDEKTGDITYKETGRTTVSVIKSDELQSVARIKNLEFLGRSVDNVTNETVYDWYDIEEIHTHTIIDGVETNVSTETKLGDEVRTTTNSNWQWLADSKVDDGSIEDLFKPTSGIVWSSSTGQGGETKSISGKGEISYENIDLLLSTLGTATTAAGTSQATNFIEGLKQLVDALSVGKDLIDNEITIPDAIEKMESKKQEVVNGKTKCPSCKQQEDSTHIDNVKGVGTFDKITK
jgi:hypothetical protein